MKTLITKLILVAIIWTISMFGAVYGQNQTATHKTIVATPTVTLKLEGKVQVVESKGSRIIVETYVSCNGGETATKQIADKATPIATVVNDETVISQHKQFIVNNSNAQVSYKVFIPKGTVIN
jgi:hypothetical protein